MLLLMPLDDEFLGADIGNHDTVVEGAIDAIRSWSPPSEEVWRSEEDLPEGLRQHYDQLHVDSVKRCCKASREWGSIEAVSWNTLLLLPFARVTTRIAALYLKDLAEHYWPRRRVTIEWCQLDPLTAENDKMLLRGFAAALWDILYRPPFRKRGLNVTACSHELGVASMMIASLAQVPVYCWSASLKQMLCLPGWEIPLYNDRDREHLKDMLNGVTPQGIGHEFLSRWLWVIGQDTLTATALILQEWFEWKSERRLGEDPFDVTGAGWQLRC